MHNETINELLAMADGLKDVKHWFVAGLTGINENGAEVKVKQYHRDLNATQALVAKKIPKRMLPKLFRIQCEVMGIVPADYYMAINPTALQRAHAVAMFFYPEKFRT